MGAEGIVAAMTDPARIDRIDEAALKSLGENRIPENRRLEFKREPYDRGDSGTKELLKDISAFANSEGGVLLIGVSEAEPGIAGDLMPIDPARAATEIARYQAIALACFEPRVPGLRFETVNVTGGLVIAVGVPKSWNLPHRANHTNSRRFFVRNDAGVHEPEVEELRDLFGRRDAAEDRARAFVEERLARIGRREAPVALNFDGGLLAIHLLPLPEIAQGRRYSATALEAVKTGFYPLGDRGASWRFNIDGYLNFERETEHTNYTQIYKNGGVEAVLAPIVNVIGERGDPPEYLLAGTHVANRVREALGRYLSGMRELGCAPPVAAFVTLLGVRGAKLRPSVNRFSVGKVEEFEASVLKVPEVVIPEFRDGGYDAEARDILDTVWNAFGHGRCWDFDEVGAWSPLQQRSRP